MAKYPQNPERSNKETRTAEEPMPVAPAVTTAELREHLKGLQGISAIASKLFVLLGEQITAASHTIPIQRGNDILQDLRSQYNVHKDGLKTAFNPLKEQIKQIKIGFWEKHGATLEAAAEDYIKKRIQERVLVEVNKQLERYFEYLKTNEAKKRKVREEWEVLDARLQNSLLRTQHPQEHITWIGGPPSWTTPPISLGDLVNVDHLSMIDLAKSLGLSPSPEDDRIDILNSVMRTLGIAYRGLPSRSGMYLVPTMANL